MFAWNVETGMIAVRRHRDEVTYWTSAGVLDRQYSRQEVRDAPPWLWGETDQLEPSAPWCARGESFEEWTGLRSR